MIPKIIHYCWFGDKELSPLAKKCIESWKKYCPNCKIKEWNESNYDIKKNKYMYDAYINRKWAFVSDYARLDIVYNEGGIYLDTDVELIKPIDELLNNKAYCGIEQVKNEAIVNFGLGFGAEKNNKIIYELLKKYDKLSFVNTDKTLNLIASPIYQTNVLKYYGLLDKDEMQKLDNITVYPTNYFNPMDLDTGIVKITNNTYSIHHYAASWISKRSKIRYSIHKLLNIILGKEFVDFLLKKDKNK